MTNREVCDCINQMKNINNFYAERLVDEGYGQNTGGYLARHIGSKPTQQEHFISYYQNKEKVTYQYLRCPQLLIFIAEASGVSNTKLEEACNILKKYECKLENKDKDGNYMCKTKELKKIKAVLQISNIVKIIKESEDWNEVQQKVKTLNSTGCYK